MPEGLPWWGILGYLLVTVISAGIGGLSSAFLERRTAANKMQQELTLQRDRAVAEKARADEEWRRQVEAQRAALEFDRDREHRAVLREQAVTLGNDAAAFTGLVLEMHRIRGTLDVDEPVSINGIVVAPGAAIEQRDRLHAECWGWGMRFAAIDRGLGLEAHKLIDASSMEDVENRKRQFRERLSALATTPNPHSVGSPASETN